MFLELWLFSRIHKEERFLQFYLYMRGLFCRFRVDEESEPVVQLNDMRMRSINLATQEEWSPGPGMSLRLGSQTVVEKSLKGG